MDEALERGAQPGQWLTEAELGRIRQAVTEAEKGISGEIVVYVAPASDEYPEAAWEGAAYGGAVGAGAVLAWDAVSALWHPLALVLLAVLGCGALGLAAGTFSGRLRRLLAGAERLDAMARRGAAEAFLEKEVFRTRERTGILLYVSLFEREVAVLGDSGINAKVREADWEGVVSAVTAKLRAGRTADGIVEGVRLCRETLLQAGFAARPDDTDELPDEPGQGKRG